MISVIFLDLDETLVAQEEAFAGAYRATAELAAEAAGVDAESFARAIPVVAASCFERLPIAGFVRRCRFGGRDVLWGNPFGSSEALRELAALAPKYRQDVWTTVLAQHSVSDQELWGRLDARFRHEMTTRVAAFAEVERVLVKLSSRYRLAIITNGMPAAQAEKVRRLGFEQYFETLVASAEIGIGKPAGEIFRHALAGMSVPADESVMVGDSLDGDVKGARQVGMRACWVRRDASAAANDAASIPSIPNLTGLEALLESSAEGESSWSGMKAVSSTS